MPGIEQVLHTLTVLILAVTLLGSGAPPPPPPGATSLLPRVLKNEGVGVDWDLNQAGLGSRGKGMPVEGPAKATVHPCGPPWLSIRAVSPSLSSGSRLSAS